jgi:glycosyltransferase involved in cell wall biosynthesis
MRPEGFAVYGFEIPTLMSPVGVNTEIIQHGVNGYLPNTEDEWVDILSSLIKNKELRKELVKQAGKQL